MTVFNRLKWILGILMVFVVILATNLLDRNNFLRVRDSVVAIYEDRLVAKDIIFDMSKEIHEKRVAVVSMDSTYFKGKNNASNEYLEELTQRFQQTELTSPEKKVFNKLTEDISKLQSEELERNIADETDRQLLLEKLSQIDETLEKLSEIQMLEGRRQMKIGKSAVSAVELFTQIELYFLVALAIVIQILVMYRPKTTENE